MHFFERLKSLVIKTVNVHVHVHCRPSHTCWPAVRVDLVAGPITEQAIPPPEPGIPHMQTLTDTQQVTLSLDIRNKKGNPADVDGAPQWSSSNPAVATVEPSADGKSALVKAQTPGDTTIAAVADADLGSGVVEITGIEQVQVKAGQAVTVGFVAGVPEEQP